MTDATCSIYVPPEKRKKGLDYKPNITDRMRARALLWRAGLVVLDATTVLLWPGRTEERSRPIPPLHAHLAVAFAGHPAPVATALLLDDTRVYRAAPRTGPLATLTPVGRAVQAIAVGRGGPDIMREAYRRLREVDEAPIWQSARCEDPHLLRLTAAGLTADLPCGVTVIKGPTSSGKTTLVEGLREVALDNPNAGYVDWGEPVDDAAGRYSLGHLEHDFTVQLSARRALVVGDSLTRLLLGSENVGTGGLSQAFLAQLNTLAAAAELGRYHLVFTMNTLTMTPLIAESVDRALKGNVTSVVSMVREEGSAPIATVTSRRWPGRGSVALTAPNVEIIAA